jgi:PAS domain S-box-containing protein
MRRGRGQGDSKRQAQGSSTSPQPYLHESNTSYFDGALSSDQVLDSQAYNSFTSSERIREASSTSLDQAAMATATATTPRPVMRSTQSQFAVPRAPQSARHQAIPTSPAQTPSALPSSQTSRTKPSLGKTNTSGSGSGSGNSASHNATSPVNSSSRNISLGGQSNKFTFTNYVEGINNRSLTSFAMMDLDESLRAIYFAPIPLIVLDNNRTVKMLNRPAELLLGIGGTTCAGQRLEKYVIQSHRAMYTLALNEAAENFAKTSSGLAKPVATRLEIQPLEGRASIWADWSISAWFPTDTLFGSSTVDADRSMHSRDNSESTPSTPSPHSADVLKRGGGLAQVNTTAAPAIHEALFTISIVPSRASDREISPSNDQARIADSLKEAAFNHVEAAVMAMSKDGHTIIRNKACDEVLISFERREPKQWSEKSKFEQMQEEGKPFGLSWIDEMMFVYDENFDHPLQDEEWPIVKSAFLGQSTQPLIAGCVSKSTGERSLLEVQGVPLRDNGGYGEHIGGLITLRNITAEKLKIKEQVQEQGDVYFRQTIDQMPQLVWITSPTGYHEYFSQSWYTYTGSDPHASQGVGWASHFHEEDLPEAGKRWSHSLRTGDLYETAYRCRRYDGVWRWFLGRALPMKDENGVITKWFGTCTDIHDQVEALSASRRAQSQLESVINHAAMTLWAVDRDGVITVAEGPGVRQLKLALPGTPGSDRESAPDGRPISEHDSDHPSISGNGFAASRKSMIGRSIYTIWDSTNIRESMKRALQGEYVVEEMELDGRWFRTSYTPLRAQSNEVNNLMEGNDADGDADMSEGEIVGVVGASMDISDRKKAQEQMEESLLEKTRALAAEGAAREASRLKSEFLANMSHEIRTPIAGVIGLSELLLDEKGLTAQHRDYAETIQRSAEGLLTVINDVLDFSKVEIGKLDVEQSPFNLEVLLRDAKRMLSFATQKKGLDFRDSVELNYKGQVVGGKSL